MRIFIVDPVSYRQGGVSTGHYLPVAENLIEVLSANNQAYVIGGDIYKEKFGKKLLLLKRNTFDKYSKIHNKWNTILNIRQVYKETTSEDVLIWQSCSVATILIGILLFGTTKRHSFLIQYNARMLSNKLFRLLFSLVKKKLRGIICTLDEVGKQFDMPYCVVPDYIYCNNNKKESYLSYHNRKYDFCMVGMIREDKGIIEVARKLAGTSYNILIAGRPDNEEIREQLVKLSSNVSNINLKLEYVSDEQYDDYIRNSKYCVLNYRGDYSQRTSGVVYDVLFKGTPVVGNDCQALSFIKENQIGYLYSTLDIWEPSSVLDESIHSEYLSHIQKYYLFHETYQKKLNEFVQQNF